MLSWTISVTDAHLPYKVCNFTLLIDSIKDYLSIHIVFYYNSFKYYFYNYCNDNIKKMFDNYKMYVKKNGSIYYL